MFNVAIMGTGSIAGKMANTISYMDNVEVYAVASRTFDKAKTFADKYHIQRASIYGSYIMAQLSRQKIEAFIMN